MARYIDARATVLSAVLLAGCGSGSSGQGDGDASSGSAETQPPDSRGTTGGETDGADETGSTTGEPSECLTDERHFAWEVWSQTLQTKCLACHSDQGLASATRFVLRDDNGDSAALEANYAAFIDLATEYEGDDDRPVILRKPLGELGHGGGPVITEDSADYRRLDEAAMRLDAPTTECADDLDFLAGVELESPYATLRRFALNFAYRLPSASEIARVDEQGEAALGDIIEEMMDEEAFSDRTAEGFNDVFLTEGAAFNIAGLGTVNHPTLLWFLELPEPERGIALGCTSDGIVLAGNALIKNIVSENEPFSNVLLADYTMVNPFSARSFDVFDDITWTDPEDPEEFHPAQLHFSGAETELPHAGILNNYIYLDRYQSTPTNVNRARARAFLLHFLGVDILQFSPENSDPLATIAEYENPVRDASDCAICHLAVDPIAGVFRNYQSDAARYPGPVPEDTFPAGFELASDDDETVPVAERTWTDGLLPASREFDALLWLGEQAVADPRFATTMVEHIFGIVLGRPVLRAPSGELTPQTQGAFLAYEAQREALAEFRDVFVDSNYSVKAVVKAIVLSPFYRARFQDADSDEADAMRFDLGAGQLMTPEQLHRKILAIFGDSFQTYPAYEDALMEFGQYRILYGGIDSTEVTERIGEPNGLMAGIQQLVANNVSCRQVSREFDRPPGERLLFADVELSTFTGADEDQVRDTLVHLHERVIGERLAPDDPAIDISYDLFTRVRDRGAQELARGGVSLSLGRPCEAGSIVDDPDYVVRAWAAVLNYQMQSFEFLYQ